MANKLTRTPNSPSPGPTRSAFLALTRHGLKTLHDRLDDTVASAMTTAGTAQHAGKGALSGKLLLMSTTLNAMSERVKALREKMPNARAEARRENPKA